MSIRCTGPARHERVTANTYHPSTVVHPPRDPEPIDGGMVVAAYAVIAAITTVMLLCVAALWRAL
jgi:hypothetical protein